MKQNSLALALTLALSAFAHAAQLELPRIISKEWEAVFQAVGLTQAKTIEVWPAGLAAAASGTGIRERCQ